MIKLFVTGMFRSGTTTIARALNAHPYMAVAADPYSDLFKALRSDEAMLIQQDIPVSNPLSDYYFDNAGQALLKQFLLKSNMDKTIKSITKDQLFERVRSKCAIFSQTLVPFIAQTNGSTYKEILDSFITHIYKAYGNSNTTVVGFKEVWLTEFIPTLARSYSDFRFLIIQRDPRAVCASKNARPEKYPWLFLCRQWRKLAALDWVLRQNPELGPQILSIRYEDFITEPEKTTRKICEFLGVEWHADIANPEAYRDGAGNVWKQNTAYGGGKTEFNSTSLNQWQNVLSDNEIKFIEYICCAEMMLYGYKPINSNNEQDVQLLLNPPRIDNSSQAKWMRGIISNDVVRTVSSLAEEYFRHLMLGETELNMQEMSPELIESAYLDISLYMYLSRLNHV